MPLGCKKHPNKPANKMCKKCGVGLCKYCPATELTDSRGEHSGFVCFNCGSVTQEKSIKIL